MSAAAARHPDRTGRPRRTTGNLLPVDRPGATGPQPARPGHRRRPCGNRRDGQPGPVPLRRPLQVLPGPGATRLGDRQHRPQGPTHVQSRIPTGPRHPHPRRRPRPQTRPATRPGLPPADGPTRRRSPQSILRSRSKAGRTTLDRHAPPHALRHLRHQRHPSNHRGSKEIIADQWTVSEDVRRRRRSSKTKTGKAPHQVHPGHDQDPRSATRRPSPHRSSATPSRTVKQAPSLTTDPP
jgi:hypothetical protein